MKILTIPATAILLALSGAAFAESQADRGPDIDAIAAGQKLDNMQTSSLNRDTAAFEMFKSHRQTIAEQNASDVRNGHRTFGNN